MTTQTTIDPTTIPMRRRRFGRTELQMPVFSCGGMRYQEGWQDKPISEIGKENQANLEATIRRSVELGINHIETARGYGPSERQLGLVLPKLPREKLIVQTKVGPEADPEVFRKNLEESFDRLQLDHVDLLGLHGINDQKRFDWACKPGGCFDVAREFQKRGKVRFIGFSTHGPLDIILKAIRHGEPEVGKGFDYVNLHWYYIFQRNWPAIEEATRRDMGVFIISPSDKGGMLYKAPPKLTELCKPLHPIVFNDLYCLIQKKVHTLSVGASKPSDFDLHMEAVSLMDRAEELTAPIVEKLSKVMRDATGVSHPEDMAKGMADYTETPGELNLEIMLWLRNLAVGWDMTEYGKMRFNLLGSGDTWFPGGKPSNLDDVDPAELVKAAGDSPFAKDVPKLLREANDLLGGAPVKRLSES
ncbi:MAG: aldo/keto reductase [Phycisphaerales bacterium]